jgi:hypothetical protein
MPRQERIGWGSFDVPLRSVSHIPRRMLLPSLQGCVEISSNHCVPGIVDHELRDPV